MSINKECSDQTAQMGMLIWTYAVHKLNKSLFSVLLIIRFLTLWLILPFHYTVTLVSELADDTWCVMWEKDPYAIDDQPRSRWPSTSVQSDLDVLCSSTYTTIFIDSVSGQWRPWSACANAQADQGLHCPQIA